MTASFTKSKRWAYGGVAFTALALLGGVALPATPAYALVRQDEEERVETAKKSNILAIELPEGAFRYHGAEKTAQITDALKRLAKESKVVLGKTEMLVWSGADAPEEALKTRLEEENYRVATKPTEEVEGFEVTVFTVTDKSKKRVALGVWFKRDRLALLCWALAKPAASSEEPAEETKENAPNAKPEATRTPAKPAANEGGAVPKEMRGEWSWTTISGVNYQDSVTGALKEPSGMSAKFTFTPDGRYKFFFYVRQRTYGLVSEATTTEEGTVTFNDNGTFLLRPTKGHYKGATGSRLIDREMTAAERKPKTYYVEWREDNGKRQLYMGPSKSSLSRFKRP